jgi:hypothetical protein
MSIQTAAQSITKIMADRGEAAFGGQSLPKRATFSNGHIHLCVAFHSTFDAPVGLCLGLVQKLAIEQPTEEKNQQPDHDRCADKLGQRDLPVQECQHNDAEFEDKISGGHFKRHGRGEIGALAKQRTSNCHSRI